VLRARHCVDPRLREAQLYGEIEHAAAFVTYQVYKKLWEGLTRNFCEVYLSV
jgi:hypothetical protein